jgi:hypothetical protein
MNPGDASILPCRLWGWHKEKMESMTQTLLASSGKRMLTLLLAVMSLTSPAMSAKMDLYKFIDENGKEVYTNVPQKYRNSGDYVEIKIDYDLISIPSRYRNYRPEQYTNRHIQELVRRYSRQYKVDENLIYAIIDAESGGNPKAVSSAGARGLMQLMPGTAEEMGVTRIFDPAQNIAGGVQYFSKMLQLFKGDENLALAAYNAGPGTVKKYGAIPPFKETRRYVQKVQAQARRYGYQKRDEIPLMLSKNAGRKAVQDISAPKSTANITVHFKSGLTQPADRVEEKDPYFYIYYQHRTYPVRKDMVLKVTDSGASSQ